VLNLELFASPVRSKFFLFGARVLLSAAIFYFGLQPHKRISAAIRARAFRYLKLLMRKIEHIGIAVKNLNESNAIFEKLFGAPAYKMESVESEGVNTSFFMNGPNKIELLEATNPESPIAKFLEKKGEGIHHIAFDVEDIVSEIRRLKSEGFIILNETPKKGADNKLVAFLHPKSTNGVLIELCQEIR
jgi:methylmalonyl-CoA/ethylmalonyl-CoA epimerase